MILDKKQFEDFNYKIENGESISEIIDREENALIRILNNHRNKKILIVGHFTALSSLFSKWCKINYNGPYRFENEEFF